MNYRNLFLMSLFSFISMYILMYSMVDRFANIYNNFNQLYMAALMTIPMIIFELFFMRSMYPNKKLNSITMGLSFILFVLFFMFIRRQTGIGDEQFLKSMIPHHASALLMCKKTALQDPEIKSLCQQIMFSQQSEIDLMKAKLATIIK